MNLMLKDEDRVLYEKCQAAEKAFCDDWKTLVNIDSPTGYTEGITEVGRIIISKLRSIGAKVDTFPAGEQSEAVHVCGTLMGRGKGSILLQAHMDTVMPVGSAAKRPFRIDSEGRAYGPGVADDKGSVVQVLHAMRILEELGFKDYDRITFFSNCDEENDSPTSRDFIMKLANEHDFILNVESGRLGDGIVIGRAGNGVFEIEISGKAAHAGNPQAGCNAADALAHLVVRLNQLADCDKGTLVTTRIIESGTANRTKSVVPDSASGLVRIGAFSEDELDRVLKSAEQLRKDPDIPGAQIQMSFRLDFPLFRTTEKTRKLAALACSIYSTLGRNLTTTTARSGSDACWASLKNEAVLDCLGVVNNGKNHTEDEGADATTVVPRLYLLTKMLMELGSRGL